MKERILALRNHFDRHRFAYGVIAACAFSSYIMMKRANEWNAFLEKHELFDEFYMPEVHFTVGAPE